MKKTLAEHIDFTRSCARLAFYATYLLASILPEESMEYILRQRSPLYKVALGLDPEVPLAVFSHFPQAENAEDFEEKMWRQCGDFILERAEVYYPDSAGMKMHGVWQAECFRFDPPAQLQPRRCTFHIGNPKAPDSIFSDREYVIDHLLLMLDLMEKEYGATEAGTSSWLNSNPHFLRYFPNSWQEHFIDRPPIPLWHLGYWGQIITARGTFNEKNARYFREHLAMRYPLRYSWCGIDELRTHLKSFREKKT